SHSAGGGFLSSGMCLTSPPARFHPVSHWRASLARQSLPLTEAVFGRCAVPQSPWRKGRTADSGGFESHQVLRVALKPRVAPCPPQRCAVEGQVTCSACQYL